MGAKVVKKPRQKGAIERIADLEQRIGSIVGAVNSVFTEQDKRLSALVEVVDAIVEKVGADEISAIIAMQRSDRAKENLKKAVEDGQLELSDTISETSVIVGVEYGPDGEPVPPGRIQTPFASVFPQFKEKLLGQGPGTRFETENGHSFEVLEIYEPVMPAEQSEAPLDTQEPASEVGAPPDEGEGAVNPTPSTEETPAAEGTED